MALKLSVLMHLLLWTWRSETETQMLRSLLERILVANSLLFALKKMVKVQKSEELSKIYCKKNQINWLFIPTYGTGIVYSTEDYTILSKRYFYVVQVSDTKNSMLVFFFFESDSTIVLQAQLLIRLKGSSDLENDIVC